eukprot:UN05197
MVTKSKTDTTLKEYILFTLLGINYGIDSNKVILNGVSKKWLKLQYHLMLFNIYRYKCNNNYLITKNRDGTYNAIYELDTSYIVKYNLCLNDIEIADKNNNATTSIENGVYTLKNELIIKYLKRKTNVFNYILIYNNKNKKSTWQIIQIDDNLDNDLGLSGVNIAAIFTTNIALNNLNIGSKHHNEYAINEYVQYFK